MPLSSSQASALWNQFGRGAVDGSAQVELDIRGDLVVAGAPGVQLLAGFADVRGQRRLDVHMHVFQGH